LNVRFCCLALLALLSFRLTGAEEPFYKQLDTPPAPELSPAEALEAFSIAPGFKVELVAAEPLVEDPVAIAWDEDLVLYVVEMRGYMPDAYGTGDQEPVGMVVRLDDENKDGRYDRRTVLLDGLVLPRAIAVVNEGLLVGEPPNLWFCPRRKSGIDCEQKQRLGDYGADGNVEHSENGLLPAVDNWLYSAKSDRRLRFSQGRLDIEQTLFRGQWGITQNNAGILYYNTNSNLLLGDLYDAQPVIRAGNLTGAGLNIEISKNDQLFAVRVNPGVNRAYVPGVLREDGRLNRPTSASGMAFYRGNQFSRSDLQYVFVAEPAANAVAQLALKEGSLSAVSDHVLYDDEKWQHREFLASTDERFRPVDIEVGPDGALYVVDMYRGIIQDHMFLSDQLREEALSRGLDKPVGLGRIWKVVQVRESAPGADPVPARTADLIDMLNHGNGWHRDTAQRLLIDRKGWGTRRKLERLVDEDQLLAAIHGLWTLAGRDQLRRRAVLAGLASQHEEVRLTALRAGNRLLQQGELITLGEDQSAAISHHATMYLARFNDSTKVIEWLAAEASRAIDNPIRLTGIRAAAAGSELEIIQSLASGSAWTEASEAATNFISDLQTQALRSNAMRAPAYLDFIHDADDTWIRTAMLSGMHTVLGDESFQRIHLSEPHVLFTNPPESIWPIIAKARRVFTWPGDELAADAIPLSPAQTARRDQGKTYYEERCAICHGGDGKGITSLGPPLADSTWVMGPTERLARIVLHGVSGEIVVKGETWNSVMPGHAQVTGFNNDVASGLLTYLHRAWGHTGRIVEPGFIEEIRELESGRSLPWTVAELESLDTNTHYRAYSGTYGGGPFELTISYNGRELEIASVYFNGALKEQVEGQFLFEPREFLIEFVSEAGKVTGIRIPGQGDAFLPRMSP